MTTDVEITTDINQVRDGDLVIYRILPSGRLSAGYAAPARGSQFLFAVDVLGFPFPKDREFVSAHRVVRHVDLPTEAGLYSITYQDLIGDRTTYTKTFHVAKTGRTPRFYAVDKDGVVDRFPYEFTDTRVLTVDTIHRFGEAVL